MSDLFQRLWEFYPQVVIAGLIIAVLCAVLSVFVVQKRMAFIGQGISHAAFGGYGLALLLEVRFSFFQSSNARDLLILVFCIGTALLIGFFSRRKNLSEDSAIGICLVGAMAFGMLCLDLRSEWIVRDGAILASGSTPPFHSILFGSILNVTNTEVWSIAVLSAVVLLAVKLFFKELTFFVFDEDAALVFGVPTQLVYYSLLVALAVSVIAAVKLLGVVLLSALLIIPGVTASFWCSHIGRTTVLSVVVSAVSVLVGIMLAIQLGIFSPGPVIAGVLCFVFVLNWVFYRFFATN